VSVRVKLWGTRGSIPTPGSGPAFGGNTSCVEVTCDDGSKLVLDAGTGIRNLGASLAGRSRQLHVLLTHLHLDHIQGLLFFAPFFDSGAEITVWGPPGEKRSLRERLARYLSSPLSPVEIRDLPARVSFEDAPASPWRLGECEIRAELVSHRGPTLGYRLDAGSASLCYLPDHEPGLGADLASTPAPWISGLELAAGATALIHDCQYFDHEYEGRMGWGHSGLADALAFAARVDAQSTLLFHHDPDHDDRALETMLAEAHERWGSGTNGGSVDLAREGDELVLRA
jgi:phosphoribosyl 1,2-cyclic phosphodiesterase